MLHSHQNSRPDLLDALLDSWDRSNVILLNLLRVLPPDGLDARATAGSPTVSQLFTHIHYVRLVFVFEDAPERAIELPPAEWLDEKNREQIATWLRTSGAAVREAVRGRIASGRAMETHYDHPVLMLQHMLWHEGYHHGQIKLALKMAGCPLSDDEVGPLTWSVWMNKHQPGPVS